MTGAHRFQENQDDLYAKGSNPLPSFKNVSLNDRLVGKVVRWNAEKKQGKMMCDGSAYFLHARDIRKDASGEVVVDMNDRFEFEKGTFLTGERMFRAIRCKKVPSKTNDPRRVTIGLTFCADSSKSFLEKLNGALGSERSLLRPKLVNRNDARVYVVLEGNGLVVNLEHTVLGERQDSLLRREVTPLFEKMHKEGWVEWLGGAQGWRWGEKDSWGSRQDVTDAMNKLQDVYKTLTVDIPELRYRHGKKEMWNKAPSDLADAAHDVRIMLEVLFFFDANIVQTDQRPGILSKWGCGHMSPTSRWRRIMKRVKVLMRSSNYGPDVPLQWAAHAPLNRYPLTVVTRDTQTELVHGIVDILKDLLYGHGVNLDDENMPPNPMPGVGTVWRTKSERRQSDWTTKGKQMKGFETEAKLEVALNY